jgi:hypothetical protein
MWITFAGVALTVSGATNQGQQLAVAWQFPTASNGQKRKHTKDRIRLKAGVDLIHTLNGDMEQHRIAVKSKLILSEILIIGASRTIATERPRLETYYSE